jgi:hypothetical protein
MTSRLGFRRCGEPDEHRSTDHLGMVSCETECAAVTCRRDFEISAAVRTAGEKLTVDVLTMWADTQRFR